ncbi:MAG: HD domain-containing protein [Candidatus Cloacimonetes bacterium]|nr:HD domain-containing protein [Candidatus Cloacimonadota bacterium]
MAPRRLLIVEDERIIAEDIKRTLTKFGYEVIDIVASGPQAIDLVKRENPSLVLMDINLEGTMTGVEASKIIHSDHGVPVVYLTAYADQATLNKAKITEPFGYILKPFEERELHATIEMAFYKHKMEKALQESERFLKTVIDINPNHIYVKDRDGRYLMVNQATAKLYGTTPKNMIGKTDMHFAKIGLLKQEEAEKFLQSDKIFFSENSDNLMIEEDFTLTITKRLHFQVSRVSLAHKNDPNCLLGVAVDITERKKIEQKLEESNEKLKRLLEETVNGLVGAVEMRDPYTAGHQRRVAKLACAIAKEMGFDENRLTGLRIAGLLHDIGKMNIPAEILTKPGKLSELEFNLVKIHPEAGYDILKDIEFPWEIAKIVIQHHEAIDGSGYPNGIKGDEILLEAKIITVADVVESMASHRPYRANLGISKAIKEIRDHSGTRYDYEIVDICVGLIEKQGFEF